eukprot:172113-Prymnesium_polylepis.1
MSGRVQAHEVAGRSICAGWRRVCALDTRSAFLRSSAEKVRHSEDEPPENRLISMPQKIASLFLVEPKPHHSSSLTPARRRLLRLRRRSVSRQLINSTLKPDESRT